MTKQRMVEILAEEMKKTDIRPIERITHEITEGIGELWSSAALTAMQRAVDEVEKPLVIKDREQLIYDLRRFADQSLYISEISKIGANEIINFLIDQIKAQVQSELTTLRAEVERLKQCEAIVREIAEDDNWLSGNPKCRQWVKENPE